MARAARPQSKSRTSASRSKKPAARRKPRAKATKAAPRRDGIVAWAGMLVFVFISTAIGIGWLLGGLDGRSAVATQTKAPSVVAQAGFTLCSYDSRDDCVVDGDTFRYHGQTIRIADIDTPEVFSYRCPAEKELGERATDRLHVLLNAGPFDLEGYETRDEDQYGRKLRIVSRDGQSLGMMLVREGLAREWDGRRRPWC
jgi:endonuclease YncB( thermonuclease family)